MGLQSIVVSQKTTGSIDGVLRKRLILISRRINIEKPPSTILKAIHHVAKKIIGLFVCCCFSEAYNLSVWGELKNGGNSLLIDASEGDDALKASKHTKRSENQNGNQPIRKRQPTINGHRVRDADATIPARRDSSCQAATKIVKETKDLKHSVDCLKNSGLSVESTGLYFQAALKFLHGASLLESSNGESAKQGEMIRSMQMCSNTAKLCEFCAHEYEKSKDIAAAALAYKCMEVAYMRVIYYSHANASSVPHELQTALQIVPPGN